MPDRERSAGIGNLTNSHFLHEVSESLQMAGIQLNAGWFDRLLSEASSSAHFPLRRVGAADRARLKRQGNSAEDWNLVLVAENFSADHIIGNHFADACVIGRFNGNPATVNRAEGDENSEFPLSPGIYHSTLRRAVVDDHAAVHRCPLVSGYRITSGASVFASTLIFSGVSACGNDGLAHVGVENGGRPIPLLAELTLFEANLLAGFPSDPGRAAELMSMARDYAARASCEVGIVGAGAIVRGCSMVRNAWIGSGSVIDGATLVEESTILSSPGESTFVGSGSVVRGSVLQPGVEVRDGAIVDRSLLLEHSHVERHGKVTASVIGPNSGVAEGEVTASLVGPFVGFHHQALLIATCWPGGRGNVAYGANVGSNHTSRLPDQELWAGEGMFFGLGCNVKFPANFLHSPYSLIATGLTTLPQKLSMPFSLLCEPVGSHPEAPTGYAQLVPGWVLRENFYAIWRDQTKFRERNRARRQEIASEIFRGPVLEDIRNACDALASAMQRDEAFERELFLPSEIPEIGRNFVTAVDLRAGIEIFRFFLEWARIRAILDQCESGIRGAPPPSGGERRFYQEAVKRIAEMAQHSRAKDYSRGGRIFEDYERIHGTLADDPMIAEVTQWAASESDRAAKLKGGNALD